MEEKPGDMQRLKSWTKPNRNVKAISPLITTMLLVAVAVSASVITYSWVMSWIGMQSQQAQTRIGIDALTWNIPSDSCAVVIRNMGSVGATIGSIAIRDSATGSTFYANSFTSSNSIAVGTTISLTWSGNGASAPIGFLRTSAGYVIRVITTTGFECEILSVTPSA